MKKIKKIQTLCFILSPTFDTGICNHNKNVKTERCCLPEDEIKEKEIFDVWTSLL